MNELLIKTIINQARTIERYSVQACEDIDLKARIEELEHISSKLSYPERMKKLVITNRDLRGKLIAISKKDRIKELEQEIEDLKLKVQSYNPNEFMVEARDYPEEPSYE